MILGCEVTRSIRDEPCVLCSTGRSGREGELVLPRWLLNDLWPVAQGPYTTHRNGEPLTKRDGTPRSQTSAVRHKLPMCPSCNGILNDRFEVPAKPLIRRLLLDKGPVGPQEADIVGEWFVKTWLLLSHPQITTSDPGSAPTTWEPDPKLYTWMFESQPAPPDISVWLLRVDLTAISPITQWIPLPVVVADGRTLRFRSQQVGLGRVEAHLVHHPGWPISHPLEDQGRALRLWPSTASALDIASLPEVPANEVRWLTGPQVHFVPDTYWRLVRQPLSPSTDFMAEIRSGVHQIRR